MLKIKELKKIYKGKKVLITGHTGFKGTYMCVLLNYLGAITYGYALKPENGSLYDLLSGNVGASTASPLVTKELFADIRDEKKLTAFMKKIKPDYIIHMAAQPLVLRGYEEPAYTYDVNVMGTVSLMEAIRKTYNVGVKHREPAGEVHREPVSILNVTTDKVYENNDLSNYAFRESDKLCGRDPYANSKSCSELVTYAYKKSFFSDEKYFRISTARAGNVIGGGDLNENRIIPDCYRAIKNRKVMLVRSPKSIRPYQYVLEPLILYLNILAYQKKNAKYAGSYNIGPDKKACLTTRELVEKFFEATASPQSVWASYAPERLRSELVERMRRPSEATKYSWGAKCPWGASPIRVIYNRQKTTARHEASFLRLDNKLIKKTFGYKEIFKMKDTMRYTTDIYLLMLNESHNKKAFTTKFIDYIYKIFDKM